MFLTALLACTSTPTLPTDATAPSTEPLDTGDTSDTDIPTEAPAFDNTPAWCATITTRTPSSGLSETHHEVWTADGRPIDVVEQDQRRIYELIDGTWHWERIENPTFPEVSSRWLWEGDRGLGWLPEVGGVHQIHEGRPDGLPLLEETDLGVLQQRTTTTYLSVDDWRPASRVEAYLSDDLDQITTRTYTWTSYEALVLYEHQRTRYDAITGAVESIRIALRQEQLTYTERGELITRITSEARFDDGALHEHASAEQRLYDGASWRPTRVIHTVTPHDDDAVQTFTDYHWAPCPNED